MWDENHWKRGKWGRKPIDACPTLTFLCMPLHRQHWGRLLSRMEPWSGPKWFTWTLQTLPSFPLSTPSCWHCVSSISDCWSADLKQLFFFMEALWWLFSSCPKVEAVLCRDFSLSTSLGKQNISGLSGYGFSCFTESRTVGVDVLAEIKCDFVDESRSAVIHRQVPALFPRLLHRLSLALLRKLLHPFFWQCSWHWLEMTNHKIFLWVRGWNVSQVVSIAALLRGSSHDGERFGKLCCRFQFSPPCCSQREENYTLGGFSLQRVLQTLFRHFIPCVIPVSPRKCFITNSICSENCFPFKQPKPVGWETTSKWSGISAGSGNSVLAACLAGQQACFFIWLEVLTMEISSTKCR